MMSGGQDQNQTYDVIDEHLFVEALALTALDVPYKDPQPTSLEKVNTIVV